MILSSDVLGDYLQEVKFTPSGMHALPPEKVAELRAKIETEREQLKQKTDMAEEERDKAAAELEKREQDIKESE